VFLREVRVHHPARTTGILLVLALGACGHEGDGAAAPPAAPAGPSTLRIMTHNLYLGADLDLLATSADLPATVERIWSDVQATDFPARAKVLADSIQAADPDLVALQEVALWRTQTPGDHLPVPDASTVALDFLDVLSKELAGRGLSYRVVVAHENADFELPGSSGTDYRLTDRDVFLAKTALPITGSSSGTYPHAASLPIPPNLPGGGPLQASLPRGWVYADVRAGGRTVRVFNTHLEAVSADVATQQVSDLLAVAQPAARPTVIVGDMNLPPGSAGYARFLETPTRLGDAWTVVHPGDAGLTCCWNPDLRGGSLSTRIDLLFATPEARPTAAARLEEGARTASGLTPSDHLGVVATFDVSGASTASSPAATVLAH
jgi:endonuclease/exonuclease/phosphatase family metal-dependent hydrolase